MLRILMVVVAVANLLGGCRQETPQKAETGQAAVTARSTERSGLPQSGEALFKQYCSTCHPDGGNVSDPSRPLYGSVLRRNHIATPEAIVRIMRNPLSRMIRFDASTLSDKEARAIAEYVLATFK